MSHSLHPEVILRNAKQKEKEYDWLEAAESFKKASDLVYERDFAKRGEIHEKLERAHIMKNR